MTAHTEAAPTRFRSGAIPRCAGRTSPCPPDQGTYLGPPSLRGPGPRKNEEIWLGPPPLRGAGAGAPPALMCWVGPPRLRGADRAASSTTSRVGPPPLRGADHDVSPLGAALRRTIPAARGGLGPRLAHSVRAGTIPAARGGHFLTCANARGQAAPRSVCGGWPADSSAGVAGAWRSWPSDVDAGAVDVSATSARSAVCDSHFP